MTTPGVFFVVLQVDAYPYFLAFVSADDEDAVIIYCVSSEEAITVHPVDATWICKTK